VFLPTSSSGSVPSFVLAAAVFLPTSSSGSVHPFFARTSHYRIGYLNTRMELAEANQAIARRIEGEEGGGEGILVHGACSSACVHACVCAWRETRIYMVHLCTKHGHACACACECGYVLLCGCRARVKVVFVCALCATTV
jgi:hypothetical protein